GQESRNDDTDPLAGMIGLDEVREQIDAFAAKVDFAKNVLGEDPRDSFEPNYAFCGPPGTGKTTVAGVIGKIFCKYEMLATPNVYAIPSNTVLGNVVGDAAVKMEEACRKALGGVLVLDEISGFVAGHPQFRKDAIGVLLDFLEKNRGK